MKVLMIGPGRGLKGGISSVIESYYNVGLNKLVDLDYLETFIEGKKIKKIIFAIKSLLKFKGKAKNSEIVHIHMSSRGSFYRKSLFVMKAYNMNKKIIIHIHGSEFQKFYHEESNSIQKKYIKRILNKSNKVIALSDEWKTILSEIVENNKIEVLYNSIEVKSNLNNKNYEEENILFLGRLGKRKGVYDILEVAPKIISKHPNVKFIIAGDGEVDNVRTLCKEKGIEKNVKILGWTSGDDKIKLLNQATVYLLPSYNEGMPISILEAMSYKLPVVSTNIGGIPQLVREDIEGYLFNPGDLSELESILNKILSSEKLRKKLGGNSFEKVDKHFNIEKNIYKLCSIYRKF